MFKKKRKVGRPSKKDIQRERYLEIAGVLSIALVFAISLFGLKNYITDNLSASVTKQQSTKNAAQRANQQVTQDAAQRAQQEQKKEYEEKVRREQQEVSRIDISNASVSKIHTQYYIGKPITPRPTLILNINGQNVELKNDNDVTLRYQNNVNIGTATIIYTGQGNYKGQKKVRFNIVENKLSNKNEITIKNIQRNINDSNCSNKPIRFNFVAPKGITIRKIEYITPIHGWKNLETSKYSCSGNICTIKNADRSDYEYYRVTASNGTVQQFGPYKVCTTPMVIKDIDKLRDISASSKAGKCQSKVTFIVQDTLKTEVTRVQYSEDNGKTWKTFTKISRNKDKSIEKVEMTNSHKNMLIKAKNLNGVEQVFGSFDINICSKK